MPVVLAVDEKVIKVPGRRSLRPGRNPEAKGESGLIRPIENFIKARHGFVIFLDHALRPRRIKI